MTTLYGCKKNFLESQQILCDRFICAEKQRNDFFNSIHSLIHIRRKAFLVTEVIKYVDRKQNAENQKTIKY